MKDREAHLLWTEDGTWLQVVDGYGRTRLSDLGPLARLSVELFAHDRGIEFCDVRARKLIDSPAGRQVAS